MTDPRPFFAAQDAAYALEDPSAPLSPQVLDVLVGDDTDGPSKYGVIWQEGDGSITVAFRGTSDKPEWFEDFDVAPVDTPLGKVTKGIWISYGSLRLQSGKPLFPYRNAARVVGHSRGGPMAILWSADFGCAAIPFACPKLVGQDVLDKAKIDCAWHVDGDIVPDVDPAWPGLPLVQRIRPPAGVPLLDIAAHHIFSTYKAAIEAFYSTKP